MTKMLPLFALWIGFGLSGRAQDGFTLKKEASNGYVDSLKEGKWIEYIDSASRPATKEKAVYYSLSVYLHNEIPFIDGHVSGIVKEYYSSGKIKQEPPFTDAMANGIVKTYYESGKLAAEGPTIRAFAVQPADTVRKEIPLDRKGKPNLSYQFDKQKAAQLRLEPIESGFDSLEIRIWLDYSMAWNKPLIILTRKNGEWNGRFITMRVEWSSRQDSELVIHPSSNVVVPKMGWEEFARELFKLGITTLPNGPASGMDGVDYNIEVATIDQYRYYGYWSPETTEAKFWGSKKMVQILHLLERAFDFKRTQL